jgi:hypothetical protein
MTSKMTDALAPLGAAAKLYKTAADTLRTAKLDVNAARGSFIAAVQKDNLLDALATEYLNRVAADMRHAARTVVTAKAVEPPGQKANEAQNRIAGGHPLAVEADEVEAVEPPGQRWIETQTVIAGGHPLADDADEADAAEPPGQSSDEAQGELAGGHPPMTVEADEADAVEPPGLVQGEAQIKTAGGHPSPKQKRVKVHAHTRSPAQKAAAKFATAVALQGIYARQISGKPIGEWTFAELHGLQRSLVQKTAGFVQLGTDTARDTLLVTKILHHAQVVDPETKVMDAISPDTLAELDREAISEAPVAIAITMQATAAAFARQLQIDPQQ